MIININSKKLIEGEKPVFDLQGPTEITLKTDQDFQSLSTSLYLAGSRVYNDSTKILFLSNTFTINEDEITFIVDTYTENYLKYISEYKTPFNLEFGASSDNKTIFLLDKAFANPRVYVEGSPPSPVDEYYTKIEADAKFLTILSSHQLYYTKEESDERYLGGDLSGYLKLDDPKPISGNLVVNGSTSTTSLILNGNPFNPSDYANVSALNNYLPLSGGNVNSLSINNVNVLPASYALKSDLSSYLPISGGDVGYLSINNVNVIPSSYALKSDLSSYLPLSGGNVDDLTINSVRAASIQDLEDYMPISGGAFEGEVSLPSAIVSSLIQNGVNYDLSKMAEDYTLSSFTSTTLTPTSNVFYHSASALASLTLTIPTGVRNTFIFFETGSTFSATITLDSSLFVNEEMVFEENKAYLIAIERDCVLWTEMTK